MMASCDPDLELEVGSVFGPRHIIRSSDAVLMRYFDYPVTGGALADELVLLVRHPTETPKLYGFDSESAVSVFTFETCIEIYANEPATNRYSRPLPDCVVLVHYWQKSDVNDKPAILHRNLAQHIFAHVLPEEA